MVNNQQLWHDCKQVLQIIKHVIEIHSVGFDQAALCRHKDSVLGVMGDTHLDSGDMFLVQNSWTIAWTG